MKLAFFLTLTFASFGFAWMNARKEKFAQGASVVVWIAVVGAFVAFQQGLWSSAGAVVLTIGLTAMAAFPISLNHAIRQRAVWALPAILAMLASFAGDVPFVDGHFVLLVVAALAATVAGLCMVLGAAFLRPPKGLLPITLSTIAGFALLGFTRSPLATGFQFSLAGPDGPVYWELASIEGFPEGLRLLATNSSSPYLSILAVFVGIELLLVVVILLLRDGEKLKKVEWFTRVPPMLALVLVPFFRPESMVLPDEQPYRDFTRLALQTRQIDPIMAESAHFLQTEGLTLDRAGMLPDFVLLMFGMIVLAFAGWQLKKDEADHPRESRDLFVRGVAFLWLGWFLTMFFQASQMGSLGLHSPGEWIHLGLVTLSTALLLLGWRHSTKLGSFFAAWAPGLLLGVWVLFVAVAWSYRSILGFSVTLG